MTSFTLRIPLLFVAVLLSSPAFAVYKCESNGTVSYSDQACPGGAQIRIDEGKSDSEAAKHQLAEEKKTLSRMERERHQREARQEREDQRTARVWAAKQKKCKALALKNKWAQEDVSSATPKTLDKERLKARRTEEKYATECGT